MIEVGVFLLPCCSQPVNLQQTPNSPRKAIPLGGSTGHHDTWGNPGSKTLVEGLIVDDEQGHLWKVGGKESDGPVIFPHSPRPRTPTPDLGR